MIRSIEIVARDVAAAPVDSLNVSAISWAGGIVNSLHVKSEEATVRKWLLFEVGDVLDTRVVAESERLLRVSGLFRDARVYPYFTPGCKDSVELVVVTRDRWTTAFPADASVGGEYASLGIDERNFLGGGDRAAIVGAYNGDPDIGWGARALYDWRNVYGEFVDVRAYVRYDQQTERYSLAVDKPFYTDFDRYGGGVKVARDIGAYPIARGDDLYTFVPYGAFTADAWAGRAFSSVLFPEEWRARGMLAVRRVRIDHDARPVVAPDSNRVFENRELYLASVSGLRRDYRRTSYVERFGVVEDAPVGWSLSITGGREYGEFADRYYGAVAGTWARSVGADAYVGIDAELSGFRNGARWEQTALRVSTLYRSGLYRSGEWRARFFAQTRLLRGGFRFDEEEIALNRDAGLRGSVTDFGAKRATLNLEARVYSPLEVWGFKIGGLAFADFGAVADEDIETARGYQAFGAGVRVRNESISNAIYRVWVAYNPRVLPASARSFDVYFTASVVAPWFSLGFGKPSVSRYSTQR